MAQQPGFFIEVHLHTSIVFLEGVPFQSDRTMRGCSIYLIPVPDGVHGRY